MSVPPSRSDDENSDIDNDDNNNNGLSGSVASDDDDNNNNGLSGSVASDDDDNNNNRLSGSAASDNDDNNNNNSSATAGSPQAIDPLAWDAPDDQTTQPPQASPQQSAPKAHTKFIDSTVRAQGQQDKFIQDCNTELVKAMTAAKQADDGPLKPYMIQGLLESDTQHAAGMIKAYENCYKTLQEQAPALKEAVKGANEYVSHARSYESRMKSECQAAVKGTPAEAEAQKKFEEATEARKGAEQRLEEIQQLCNLSAARLREYSAMLKMLSGKHNVGRDVDLLQCFTQFNNEDFPKKAKLVSLEVIRKESHDAGRLASLFTGGSAGTFAVYEKGAFAFVIHDKSGIPDMANKAVSHYIAIAAKENVAQQHSLLASGDNEVAAAQQIHRAFYDEKMCVMAKVKRAEALLDAEKPPKGVPLSSVDRKKHQETITTWKTTADSDLTIKKKNGQAIDLIGDPKELATSYVGKYGSDDEKADRMRELVQAIADGHNDPAKAATLQTAISSLNTSDAVWDAFQKNYGNEFGSMDQFRTGVVDAAVADQSGKVADRLEAMRVDMRNVRGQMSDPEPKQPQTTISSGNLKAAATPVPVTASPSPSSPRL